MAGASGDLASATHIAEQMVKLFGMNGSLTSVGGTMGAVSPFGGAGGGPFSDLD